jgi:phosphoribosylanthranilate isomerase
VKVKVCGLSREEDVRAACALGAWAVGFVFAPGSPRRVTLEQAERLRRAVGRGVLAVGVFEDALAAEITTAVLECGLDAVQLHGAWPSFFEAGTVQVFRGLGLKRGKPLPPPSPRVSALLLEPHRTIEDRQAGLKPSPAQQRWVWQQAAALSAEPCPIILAGGLHAGNVAEAIATAKPFAVDVSGGVESAPGVKDARKLEEFFRAARTS